MKKITFCVLTAFFLNLCYSCNVGSSIEFDNSVRVCEKKSFFSSPINYLKEKILETFLKKYIKKNTGIDSEVFVLLDKESAGNRYIFNKLILTSQKSSFKGFQLAYLNLSAVNPQNELIKEGDRLYLPNDIPVQYSVVITNKNLEYMTSSDEFKKIIEKLSEKHSNYIRIKDVKIEIIENKIKIEVLAKLQILFGMPMKVTFYPVVEAVDGLIYLRKINSDKSSAAYINKILPLKDLPMPLNGYIKKLQDVDYSWQIDKLTIKDSEIKAEGLFIIPSNYDIKK